MIKVFESGNMSSGTFESAVNGFLQSLKAQKITYKLHVTATGYNGRYPTIVVEYEI